MPVIKITDEIRLKKIIFSFFSFFFSALTLSNKTLISTFLVEFLTSATNSI